MSTQMEPRKEAQTKPPNRNPWGFSGLGLALSQGLFAVAIPFLFWWCWVMQQQLNRIEAHVALIDQQQDETVQAVRQFQKVADEVRVGFSELNGYRDGLHRGSIESNAPIIIVVPEGAASGTTPEGLERWVPGGEMGVVPQRPLTLPDTSMLERFPARPSGQ